MKTHYYFSWFADGFPEKLKKVLNEDITDRKSLVTISTKPADFEYHEEEYNMIKKEWFGKADIVFDKHHWIDYKVSKQKAHKLLRNASVIFVMGGDTASQNAFLAEYELTIPIKESKTNTIIGFSAGSENMAAQWIYAKSAGYRDAETVQIYNGLRLDSFAYIGHFERDKLELIENELLPVSHDFDIHAQCDEAVIRVKDGAIEVLGEVYLISNGKIQKIPESGFGE